MLLCMKYTELFKTHSTTYAMRLLLFKEQCNQCRECIKICHKGPLIFDIDKKEIKNIDYCNACFLCVSVCPTKALKFI